MFLHLGNDVLVELKDVISIIDIEKNKSVINSEFIETAKEEGFVRIISKDEIKSVIITEIKNRSTIFLSPITSSTLHKRTRFIDEISII